MIKVDYEFYVVEYMGEKIQDETAFKRALLKANTHLSLAMHMTPDESNLELVKLCLCEITEMIYQDDLNKEEHGGREILSENTDGYIVNYATEAEAGKIAINALDTKIYAVIRRYLASTGLLYAGVNTC